MKGCDVCGQEREVHVHALSSGPMSIASCVECLAHAAEPEWCFEYLYSMVGTKGEGLDPAVNNMETFKDGKYITFEEWVKWRRTPGEDQKKLDEAHEKAMEEMNNEQC